MININYHAVGTVPKLREANSILLKHKYMTANFPGLVVRLNYVYWPKPSLLVKWSGHAIAFHMQVKCKSSPSEQRYYKERYIILNIIHNIFNPRDTEVY